MANELQTIRTQYPQAQKWYKQLREKFSTELAEQVELESGSQSKKTIEELEQALVTEARPTKSPKEKLQTIMTQFVKELDNNGLNVAEAANTIRQDLNKSGEKIENQERVIREQLLNKIIDQFKESGQLEQMLLISIGKTTAPGASSDEIGERYEVLLQNTINLLRRVIVQTINENSYSYYTTLLTLAGYVYEDMEYQALTDIFSNITQNIQVKPGGALKVKGKQTHADNLITLVDPFVEDLKKGFTRQTEVIRKNPLKMTAAKQKELLNQINYFGEQVKTFSLQGGYKRTGNIYGLRISEQTDMFNEFMSSSNDSSYIYHTANNIKFVGRYRNILRSFGTDTLLFATKDGRYFMDDFIMEMRRNNYYMMFGLDTKTKQPTKTVVIDKPYSKAGTSFRSIYRNQT